MREIRTEIDLPAGVGDVWAALTDLEAFAGWNPFIQPTDTGNGVLDGGELRVGAQLDLELTLPGRRPTRVRPTVVTLDRGRCFAWLGTLGAKSLFAGRHVFELEPLDGGITRLVHREEFTGFLMPPTLRVIRSATQAGFEAMNTALAAHLSVPDRA